MKKIISVVFSILSSLYFTNAHALTCDVTWRNMPFFRVLLTQGASVTCHYQNNNSQGYYYKMNSGAQIVSGPWKHAGGSQYICSGNPEECVFEQVKTK